MLKFLGLSVALLALASVPAQAEIKFRVELSEIANLTYQMDCVGDLVSCAAEDYKAFWEATLLKTAEDRAQLAEWVRLRNLYSGEVDLPQAEASPLMGRHRSVDLAVKLRIAGFQAADVDDYLARLDLLVTPTDRAVFSRVVRHFLPAFDPWWRREAVAKGRPFAQKLEALFAAPAIARPFAQIERFYAPDLSSGSVIRVALMARPARAGTHTSGQQVEGTSVVEFLPEERPEDRIDVVIHELCHFLFDSSPDATFVELQKRFVANGRLSSIAAYNLLNEALATAFGNGMIDRSLMDAKRFDEYRSKEQSFYNNPNIDRAGKALLPLLDGWLVEGKTLFAPGFVDAYVDALSTAFGAALSAPQLLLSEMYLMVDADLGTEIRRPVRQALHVASLYSEEAAWSEPDILGDYRKYPRLNALFLVHARNVGELAKHNVLPAAEAQAIVERVARDGTAIYAFERTKGIFGFVIVAKDGENAKTLVQELADAEQGFLGFYPGG
jgi:hypothetical protein